MIGLLAGLSDLLCTALARVVTPVLIKMSEWQESR